MVMWYRIRSVRRLNCMGMDLRCEGGSESHTVQQSEFA